MSRSAREISVARGGSGRPVDTLELSLSPGWHRTDLNWHLIGILFCRELKRETTWARIHLVPLLMAEGDRAAYSQGQREATIEAEIMKDVKGWVVSGP